MIRSMEWTTSQQPSMNIDKPLDAIIAAKPKKAAGGRGRGARRGRPSAKAAALGASQNAAVIAANNRNKPAVQIPGRGGALGSKIILSNLPLDVTEPQVKVRLFRFYISTLSTCAPYRQLEPTGVPR